MSWIVKIAATIIANAAALFFAAAYIPGFTLAATPQEIILMAAALTLLNFILKPILKLFLGPLIVLTLGLGLIAVHAIILFILDISFKNLTIETIPALLIASLLVGIINFILHLLTHGHTNS